MARQSALRIETSTLFGLDPRADDGKRYITLAPDNVQIERVLRGMRMRILVPVKAYFGVMLLRRETNGEKVYELRLAHRDHELSVILESAADHESAKVLCRQWAAFFNQRSIENGSAPAPTDDQKTATAIPRRRCMTQIAKRRPKRFARRKPGNLGNLAIIRQGEREIICYE